MKNFYLLTLTLLISVASFGQSVFVNEIHYDNINGGTGDIGEGFEIAGPALTDLAGYSVELYNGNNDNTYNVIALSGIIPDQQNGYGTIWFGLPTNGMQNGAPDGLALIDSDGTTVIQFLSYEGVFTGSGIVSISIVTPYQYGAYHQNGSWYSQVNSGGTILFENLNFDAKGDIPIILGNDNPLPVELSSFTAIQTASNFAQLNWTTQSENNLLGYNIYRSKVENYQSSIILNQSLVNPTNTSLFQYYSYTDKNVELGNTYYYWLQSVELNGNTELYGSISIRIEEEETPELPNQTVLYPAYPNPFNPQTTIKFSIKENESGLFEIFNVKGQIVKSYPMFSPGKHEINWNGTDDNGKKVSSGVFFYKLKSESVIRIHKMLLLK